MIYVVEMGGNANHLTIGAQKILSNVGAVLTKSNKTHIADTLDNIHVQYTACDDLYDTCVDFDMLNAGIIDRLTNMDSEGDVALCIVGQCAYDSTVQLMYNRNIRYQVVEGVSVAQPLMKYATAGTVCYTAQDVLEQHYIDNSGIVVMYIDDYLTASNVKLHLMQYYDYDSVMYVYDGAHVTRTTLDKLDGQQYSYLTSILVLTKPLVDRQVFGYSSLVDIMRILRSPDGCPWDRAQTHASIATNAIEEAYELVNALDGEDIDNIIEELGDVLLQVVLHHTIGVEEGEWESNSIYSRLGHKLISRHTHVFGDDVATDQASALNTWEVQKQKEHKISNITANIVDVPRGMSAILRCQKVQSRASKGNYDFANIEQALSKVKEELSELTSASTDEDKLMEAGDVLFAVINVIRLMGVSSEVALVNSTNKFVNRVTKCEQILAERGHRLSEYTMQQFDLLWSEAKGEY